MPNKDRRSHSIAAPEELISIGFVTLPKRWVAERTFAWHGRDRRHTRDDERYPESGTPRGQTDCAP